MYITPKVNFDSINKYYNSFATLLEKSKITNTLNKQSLDDSETRFLIHISNKYKRLIYANSMNVDSRLDRVKNNPYNTSVLDNNKTL